MARITRSGAPRLLLALAVVLSAGVVAVATAAAGTHVSGSYSVTGFGDTNCVPLDEVRLHCTTTGFTSAHDGDLVGSSESSFEQTINCATGRTNGRGEEVFEGSLLGGPAGTMTWRLSFHADFDCVGFFPYDLRIVAVVKETSGGLAGIRGVLHFDDTSYSGVLALSGRERGR